MTYNRSGTGIEIKEIQSAHHLLKYILQVGDTFPCSCYHSNISCNSRIQQKFLLVMTALLKINVPIHVIPAVLFKTKDLKERPIKTFKKLLGNLAKSVLFLTTFVMTIFLLQCYGKKISTRISITNLNKLSCLISGFGIAFE